MAIIGKSLGSAGAKRREDADLDITPFMNLMIVLVPVLLLSMVFARITVVDLQLPSAVAADSLSLQTQQVEVVIEKDRLSVNFPEGVLLREIAKTADGQPNYPELTAVLQELKRHLQNKHADRRNINLLVDASVPYHRVISTMDAVRSYAAVVVDEVVDAELFPDVAFGDVTNTGKQKATEQAKPVSALRQAASQTSPLQQSS